jgi:hypothetical protein
MKDLIFPIKCPNRSCLSCQPKWELEKHLETCTFSVITCPSKGCGKMVRRSQLDEHLLSCLNRNFHCPNKKLGCHKKLTFIESNDHSHSCLFVPLNCDKCGIYLQRKDLHDHAESCGKVVNNGISSSAIDNEYYLIRHLNTIKQLFWRSAMNTTYTSDVWVSNKKGGCRGRDRMV